MSEVLTISPISMPVPKATPLDLLNRAAAAGAPPEVLEKYMGLFERWEERQAKKAFDAAIARAKAEMPVIVKNRSASFGPGKTAYKYEDLASVTRSIDPVLSKHGIRYRWRSTSRPGEPVTVACIVSHDDGYSEENSLTAPIDTTGSKNPVQAIISTVTYLQRATLKAAIGLAAGDDDDGRSLANGKQDTSPVTIEQLGRIQQALVQNGVEISWLLDFIRKRNIPVDRLEDIPANICDKVVNAIANKAAQNERSVATDPKHS
jgi:hypothetical protein